MAISHVLSMTTPDNPAYEAQPQHWNSVHNQFLTITGNTAGQSTFSGTNLVFSGGPNATLSLNGNTLVFSGGAGAAGNTGYLSDDAGVTASLGTVRFSNSNGLAWGINGQTVTGSYTVPTVPAQLSVGNSNLGNTAGDTGVFTGRVVFVGTNAVSLSGSSNAGSATISINVAPQTAQTQSNVQGIIVSNTTYRTGDVSFSNLNGISFGSNGANVVSASYTVPTVPAQFTGGFSTNGNTAGDTGLVTARLVLAGGNNITLSGSTNGGSMTVTISGAAAGGAQTAISGIVVSDTTYTSGTVSFSNQNGVTIGSSVNGATQYIRLSVANQTVQTQSLIAALYDGANSISTGTVRLTNANGVSFSINGQTLSASVAAQTNQTLGLYAVSNTTGQSSSSTFDARTISFHGAGIASVGYSGGSVVISVPAGGGGGDGVVSLGMSTEGNTAGTTGLVSSGRAIFVGSGPISLSQSVNGQSLTLSINGPATSSIVGTNGISISTAGSTISVGLSPNYSASFFEPEIYGGTVSGTQANGTVYFRPFYLNNNLVIRRIQFLNSVSSQSATTMSFSASVSSQTSSSGSGSFGLSGTVLFYSRVSTGTAANSSEIISFKSNTYSISQGYSISVTWSTNAGSATGSWTTSAAFGYPRSVGSDGGVTSTSTGTSGSNSFSSTSTNQNSYSSSAIMSFLSQHVSNIRPLMVGIGTTLTPGEYWLAHIQSTNTGSGTYSMQRVCRPNSMGLVYHSNITAGYMEIGNSVSIASSNQKWGIGSYSASSQTTTTIPISQITNMSQSSLYFYALGQVK